MNHDVVHDKSEMSPMEKTLRNQHVHHWATHESYIYCRVRRWKNLHAPWSTVFTFTCALLRTRLFARLHISKWNATILGGFSLSCTGWGNTENNELTAVWLVGEWWQNDQFLYESVLFCSLCGKTSIRIVCNVYRRQHGRNSGVRLKHVLENDGICRCYALKDANRKYWFVDHVSDTLQPRLENVATIFQARCNHVLSTLQPRFEHVSTTFWAKGSMKRESIDHMNDSIPHAHLWNARANKQEIEACK